MGWITVAGSEEENEARECKLYKIRSVTAGTCLTSESLQTVRGLAFA